MPFYWMPYPYPHYRYYPEPGPYRLPSVRTNAEILGDVADALSADPGIDSSGISLEVTYGVVKLMGTVPDFDQRQLAEEDAWGGSRRRRRP